MDRSHTAINTLSLHDALPISQCRYCCSSHTARADFKKLSARSEEHTSELQSRFDLVCRLLLEKKKKEKNKQNGEISNETILKEEECKMLPKVIEVDDETQLT